MISVSELLIKRKEDKNFRDNILKIVRLEFSKDNSNAQVARIYSMIESYNYHLIQQVIDILNDMTYHPLMKQLLNVN